MSTFASELWIYEDDKEFPIDVAQGWEDKETRIRIIVQENEYNDNHAYLTIDQAKKLKRALAVAIWRATR